MFNDAYTGHLIVATFYLHSAFDCITVNQPHAPLIQVVHINRTFAFLDYGIPETTRQ